MAASTYLGRVVSRSNVVNSNQKLLNCWEPGVTKFTGSNFYNFEQDNLPLYDLEERTHFNWQKLGFPALKPHSLHLLVSANAPAELINCNSNIYTDLQAAIDALPRHITVNTRITVASFGNLGTANLADISVDPRISLEIFNLNAYDRPGIFPTDIGTGGNGASGNEYYYDAQVCSLVNNEGLYKNFCSSGAITLGGLDRGSGGVANFFLRAESSFFGFRPRAIQFEDDPFLFNSNYGELDSRVVNNYTAFVTPIPGIGSIGGIASEISRLSYASSVTFSNARALASPDNAYALNAALDVFEETADGRRRVDIDLYDPSSYNRSIGSSARTYRQSQNNLFAGGFDINSAVKVNLYGNYLEALKISNCTGRVFIRNFHCKGNGLGVGINIDSCDQLDLESMAVTEYNDAGIHIVNSKVSFTRSLYVYRCYAKGFKDPLGFYDLSGYVVREGYPDLRISKEWTKNIESLDAPENDKSAGILAYNSDLTLNDEETSLYNSRFQSANYNLNDPVYRSGFHSCKMIARCSTGIKLVNSTLRGGQAPFVGAYSTAADTDKIDYLNLEGNANYGLDCIDSTVSLKCSLQIFHNTRGIRAKTSDVSIETFKIDNNHLYGLRLDQSKFTYGLIQLSAVSQGRFDYSVTNALVNDANTKNYQFMFDANGQHIIANNSVIQNAAIENPKNKYLGRFILRGAHGANNDFDPLPGVYLQGTKASFVHFTSLRDGVENKASIGAHLFATMGSDVTFLGSASALTCMTYQTNTAQGNNFSKSERFVSVVADSNSTVRFRGPTAIYDGAINVLGQKNSNIIFEPHKMADGSLDTLCFPLTDPGNHTQVELKSHRACLVVDKGSNLIMEDLGSFSENWANDVLLPNPDLGTTNYTRTPADIYTSAGFMQFYPNPNATNEIYTTAPYSLAFDKRASKVRMTKGVNYYWGFNYDNGDPFSFTEVTNGGVCVKATNNSNVRVRNVNFPCGWWNASSVIYDIYDPLGDCGKLFIWNISNNSTLHADHLSVSSAYPADVGYFGPKAVWTSGANLPAYGVPSSTPDTSSLSVLDFYGKKAGGSAAWPLPNGTFRDYGFTEHQNQGPFRLYVGVDSLSNQLYNDGSLGLATQVFAQGYNVSGNLSALLTTSSLYGKILRLTDDGEIEPSGYYYSNEFVKSDPNRIMLDHSAANSFANAKNGAMGTSNRPQICTIYAASVSENGEGKRPSVTHLGSGFRSPNIFDILEET